MQRKREREYGQIDRLMGRKNHKSPYIQIYMTRHEQIDGGQVERKTERNNRKIQRKKGRKKERKSHDRQTDGQMDGLVGSLID